MTIRTHFFIKIYISFYSRKGPTVWCYLRDRRRNIYSDRGLLLIPYLIPGARGCQRLHPLASLSETTSDRLRVPRSTAIRCILSKSPRVVFITWSPSAYPSALIALPCLLLTTWQLVKVHGITRNEPKIHGICYIKGRQILSTSCVY